MQSPVAHRLGFAEGEVVVERELLGLGDEVLGDPRELEPDGVVIEVADGEIVQAGRADTAFGIGAAAVLGLDLDGVTGQIGQRGQEAAPVVVAEAQLGAGMRALAASDDAGAPRATSSGSGGR
ncbi:MAG: hypothetical protein V7607_2540 [Solirubrobacteraceae bacterium]